MRPLFKRTLSAAFGLSLPFSVMAFDLNLDWKHGSVPIQLGGFWSSQGQAQNININGLIGNQYTANVNHHNQANGLFGTGYYINGLDRDRFQLAYGINAYYLAKTSVAGSITQEHTYTNLNYSYNIENFPVYLAAKAIVKTNNDKYNVTFDAGIGPNFMRASGYNETPLNNYTIPDNAFAAHTSTTFTANIGAGIRLNNIFGKAPLECGYRFFYLGQGQLSENNNQLLNTIKTGDVYANAIMCAVTI